MKNYVIGLCVVFTFVVLQTETKSILDVCRLPSDPGNCYAYIPRFYYNSTTGSCEQFIYGGCGGNANNFETVSDCLMACMPGPARYCPAFRSDQCPTCMDECLDDRNCDIGLVCCKTLTCGNKCQIPSKMPTNGIKAMSIPGCPPDFPPVYPPASPPIAK